MSAETFPAGIEMLAKRVEAGESHLQPHLAEIVGVFRNEHWSAEGGMLACTHCGAEVTGQVPPERCPTTSCNTRRLWLVAHGIASPAW